jgi:hypothetical protein
MLLNLEVNLAFIYHSLYLNTFIFGMKYFFFILVHVNILSQIITLLRPAELTVVLKVLSHFK